MTVLLNTAPPVIRCIGQIRGCPSCAQEKLRGGAEHVCDELCVLQAQVRNRPAGHARSHLPKVHSCGTLLDDRHGNNYERVQFCGWGTCVQFLCPGCGEFISGYGPVGCQCEKNPCGHGTFTEFSAAQAARPSLLGRLLRRR